MRPDFGGNIQAAQRTYTIKGGELGILLVLFCQHLISNPLPPARQPSQRAAEATAGGGGREAAEEEAAAEEEELLLGFI